MRWFRAGDDGFAGLLRRCRRRRRVSGCGGQASWGPLAVAAGLSLVLRPARCAAGREQRLRAFPCFGGPWEASGPVLPLRQKAEATGIPVASWSSAFPGPAYCGPGTVMVVEFDSFRPSSVQMAPSAVAGSAVSARPPGWSGLQSPGVPVGWGRLDYMCEVELVRPGTPAEIVERPRPHGVLGAVGQAFDGEPDEGCPGLRVLGSPQPLPLFCRPSI